jgi:hypothetical protein
MTNWYQVKANLFQTRIEHGLQLYQKYKISDPKKTPISDPKKTPISDPKKTPISDPKKNNKIYN